MLLKFHGPGMCRNRPGIVPMLATFLCSAYIYWDDILSHFPEWFLTQPELQQGSDRLNCNQKHVLMWYAIKINCIYINEQVASIFSCSIRAPIRSWSDISVQLFPSHPPGELCFWRAEISSRCPEILYQLIMYQLKILTCPPGWRCPRCLP